MKILISAFACMPNAGSELGVGWRWAQELAKMHDVVVVTDVTRRQAIEKEFSQRPNARLQVVFYRPKLLCGIPLNSVTAQALYTAWQFLLLPFARRLHQKHQFDFALHLTYGVFRHPSFLGYAGVPFVFGPLGGGEDAPFALKRSIKGREKFKEVLRAVLNKAALLDPFLWLAYHRSSIILAKTPDTARALPWPFRRRAIVFPEIGIDCPSSAVIARRHADGPLKVLFAGRLLGWKGAHLAIQAVAAALTRGSHLELTLVGSGPYEGQLRQVASGFQILEEKIFWAGSVPQQELFEYYQSMHCFLFPSLHDSSGNVVLEAQSFGLPIVCLDLGGPATLVEPGESAFVVNTSGKSEAEVVDGLANALVQLEKDEGLRVAMGEAALRKASEMSWGSRVSGVLRLIEEKVVR